MVRQDVEALDQAHRIHLSYVVAGSGGAGLTIMRTTFLGLQHPFKVWRSGQWAFVEPYSHREVVRFPEPYGRVNVFWFDVPETLTLAQSFDVQNRDYEIWFSARNIQLTHLAHGSNAQRMARKALRDRVFVLGCLSLYRNQRSHHGHGRRHAL